MAEVLYAWLLPAFTRRTFGVDSSSSLRVSEFVLGVDGPRCRWGGGWHPTTKSGGVFEYCSRNEFFSFSRRGVCQSFVSVLPCSRWFFSNMFFNFHPEPWGNDVIWRVIRIHSIEMGWKIILQCLWWNMLPDVFWFTDSVWDAPVNWSFISKNLSWMKALWQAFFHEEVLKGFSKNYQETWILDVPNKTLPSRKLTYPTKMEKVSFFGGDMCMWQSWFSLQSQPKKASNHQKPTLKSCRIPRQICKIRKRNMANPESYCIVGFFCWQENLPFLFCQQIWKKKGFHVNTETDTVEGASPQKKIRNGYAKNGALRGGMSDWNTRLGYPGIHLKFQVDFALLINWIFCCCCCCCCCCCGCGVCFWPSNPLGIHHQSFWWKEHHGAKGHSTEALSNETSGFFGDVNPSPNPNKSSRKLKPWNPPQKSNVTLKKKRKRGSSTLCRVSFSSFSKQNI